MKKFLNVVEDFLGEEPWRAFAAAHGDSGGAAHRSLVHSAPESTARQSGADLRGRPPVMSRLHTGFIGHGMLDAACPGQVFNLPHAGSDGRRRRGGGHLAAECCSSSRNYSGDVMNFEMAAEISGRKNAAVLVNDDVAVDDSSFTTGRRGVGPAPSLWRR